jgi:cellulose 1,4-beta-cellobiosidase
MNKYYVSCQLSDALSCISGVNRGPCPTTSGKPADVESQNGGSSVTYSNIRFGDLNSTYTV